MAKKSMILKQQRDQKFSTREYNRCKICGRPHAYLRKFGICRICFRNLAYKGEIPGVRRLLGNLPYFIGRTHQRGCAEKIKPPALGRKSDRPSNAEGSWI